MHHAAESSGSMAFSAVQRSARVIPLAQEAYGQSCQTTAQIFSAAQNSRISPAHTREIIRYHMEGVGLQNILRGILLRGSRSKLVREPT
jgi:hypothetical protein